MGLEIANLICECVFNYIQDALGWSHVRHIVQAVFF